MHHMRLNLYNQRLLMKIYRLIYFYFLIGIVSCATIKDTNMSFKPEQNFYYDNDLQLNYRVIGTGKHKIIFLHGFAASSRTWDDIIPLLNQSDTQLIVFDLIGSGFSSKPEQGDYSITANATVITKFIREKNFIDFTLVGHSFGGGVALVSAIELNEQNHTPKSLILIDAAAYKTELPFFVENLQIPFLSNLLLSITSSSYQARYTLEKIYFDKRKVTANKVNRYSYFMSLDGHENAMIQTAKQIIPPNFQNYTQKYNTLNIPALILWGSHDTVIPLSSGKRLASELPLASLSMIEQSGHNPQEEQPENTADKINSFLHNLEI